jgi:tripartite-type tricarboxylate transporter receptor subunit TctC
LLRPKKVEMILEPVPEPCTKLFLYGDNMLATLFTPLRFKNLLLLASVGAFMLCSNTLAQAQSSVGYPNKPVKILVGFTPGGVPDISARLIGQKLSEAWGQAVVVENRLGAGGNIAAQALVNAAPDGYNLLSVSSAHAVAPAIYPKLDRKSVV